MTTGIIVAHKESGIQYAVSSSNFNEAIHTKVRDLNPGETVHGYTPRSKESILPPGPSVTSLTPLTEDSVPESKVTHRKD